MGVLISPPEILIAREVNWVSSPMGERSVTSFSPQASSCCRLGSPESKLRD